MCVCECVQSVSLISDDIHVKCIKDSSYGIVRRERKPSFALFIFRSTTFSSFSFTQKMLRWLSASLLLVYFWLTYSNKYSCRLLWISNIRHWRKVGVSFFFYSGDSSYVLCWSLNGRIIWCKRPTQPYFIITVFFPSNKKEEEDEYRWVAICRPSDLYLLSFRSHLHKIYILYLQTVDKSNRLRWH